ncbi:hypothetical protein, conserved [Leishmania donovani]|uniref:Uncharacterized protein n=1 Tax=Leishmania donovani TaxID=5661 RepID=E9BHJ0_LEIDO|nr:hypothetical protein, conserved [Leishmania donovani]TPP40703.1 hypothetical protein CGC21_8505 [Leishmania donovani]CBZ34716.1 hypothetical protein, conserved [Leishmania donovani]
MQYEKPAGVMHEVIRRAFDELRLHNNAQGAITIVTHALANAEGLPLLKSGKDLNGNTPASTPRAVLSRSDGVVARVRDATASVVGAPTLSSISENGYDHSALRPRLGGSSSMTRTTQAASLQWLTAGSIGASAPLPTSTASATAIASLPAGSAECLSRHHYFNRTQVLRLLLIRCEAYSAMKQHNRALQDALNAVEVSEGQSAEAYFAVGREQRRQFNIVESASAFDTAEALLHSMQQAVAAGKNVVDGWIQETVSEEDFWAERGYQMSEVRELGITRREYELQERAAHRDSLSNSDSPPLSPLGRARTDPLSPVISGSSWRGHGHGFEPSFAGTSGSVLEVPTSLNDSATTLSFTGESGADCGAAGAGNYARDLLQCGLSLNELAMWRRLSNESRALLAMRQSHTVPSTLLGATMTLLDRRIASVRGGLIISIENNLSVPLRFIGAMAPDGLYHDAFSFPDVIAKTHCGISMLHPRGWGGYSGCVCYELHEQLSCFFYFECPLLGSLKYGVRFVEHRASDLRRAFAEMYKETGIYSIEGGTTSSAIKSPQHINSGAAGRHNGARIGGNVSIRSATTPLATTLASMNAARAAIRTPPSGIWIASHTAVSALRRPIKATARLNGTQDIAFSLSEVLAVRLRSVELAPALEYVGAATLKKLSSVSHRYRELVNNLPPPMFYGTGRRSYPDYCVASDRYSSPWIVRDMQPVTWKLVFDGRLADQEEFSISDESDMQKHILCFSADAQTKVTGYVYFGDKRCLQYIIKESWIPFSNTLYISTPVGRTFASCVATNNQTQFTLSLTSSGGGGNTKGGAAKGGDDVLYSARKRVPPAGDVATPSARAGATVVTATAISTGVVSGNGSTLHSRGSPAPAALGVDSDAATGIVEGANNVGVSATRRATAADAASSRTRGSSGGLGVLTLPVTTGGIAKATLYSPNATLYPSPGKPSSETAFNGTSTAVSMTSGKPEYYSIWRSQRVSGGAVVGSVSPATTNGGADIVAEVKVNPVLYGMVAKGYCAAEITLYPGADAMLVSLMSFLMTRW